MLQRIILLAVCLLLTISIFAQPVSFNLNEQEYFEREGISVIAFQDIYPEGHQGGVSLIMHGMRVATNGDLRLNEIPGQWQPIPKMQKRMVDDTQNTIYVHLTFPDSVRNRRGYNPIEYPDLYFNYTVKIRAQGESIVITVDLDRPIPRSFIGRVGFNLELFPGRLFGKSWYLDNQSGIFPPQPNGPALLDESGEILAAKPLATGKRLVVAPETDLLRMTIESKSADLQLFDGRYLHNNGWFVVRSLIRDDGTEDVIEWVITPNAVKNWRSSPVVQVSQIGYHPFQEKIAFIELDRREDERKMAKLIRILDNGEKEELHVEKPEEFGQFLRYNYLKFDFSSVRHEGIYIVEYGDYQTHPFKIAHDVFQGSVWQPAIEYFLPVQMCHMRVNEKYRVWHGLCHMDDALMAPINHNHFDGYRQGGSTYTTFKPGEHVPALNIGGWHDAGDYDIRVESQSAEIYTLTMIWEAFDIHFDDTYINQEDHIVEIHQPDGKPDILQQIEHGALAIINGYNSLGRLYRGIICPTLPQYIILGDGVNMTDGLIYDNSSEKGTSEETESLPADDRWVFTEDNPRRELGVAAHLAAASRALKGYNDTLSIRCLQVAEEIFAMDYSDSRRIQSAKIQAAVELYITTGRDDYRNYLVENKETITDNISNTGWIIGQVLEQIGDADFTSAVQHSVKKLYEEVTQEVSSTPYGIPYRPRIWGPGWDLQRFGIRQYFLHKAFPDIYPDTYMFNVLNFILGVHPGSNTSSFVSGVGSKSPLIAYGVNRADWSYIPGGVVSGTGLVRPDFPELLDFPFLWQQQEYCIGGHATNFVFLVLAADQLCKNRSD